MAHFVTFSTWDFSDERLTQDKPRHDLVSTWVDDQRSEVRTEISSLDRYFIVLDLTSEKSTFDVRSEWSNIRRGYMETPRLHGFDFLV